MKGMSAMALQKKAASKKPAPKGKGKGKSKAKPKGIKLTTPPFVISYPHLFEPREDDNGREKYQASAIFTPTEARWKEIAGKMVAKSDVAATAKKFAEQWSAVQKAFKKLAVEEFGCDPEGRWMAEMREAEHRTGLRSGKSRADKAGYGEGTWFFNMSSGSAPEVITRAGDDISKEEGNTKLIYAGALCRASVTIAPFDAGGGTGITVYMNNIQKLADGPRIDNRTRAKDDFDDELDSKWLDDDGDGDGDGDGDDGDSGDGDDGEFDGDDGDDD
jgi:hypothetical protein